MNISKRSSIKILITIIFVFFFLSSQQRLIYASEENVQFKLFKAGRAYSTDSDNIKVIYDGNTYYPESVDSGLGIYYFRIPELETIGDETEASYQLFIEGTEIKADSNYGIEWGPKFISKERGEYIKATTYNATTWNQTERVSEFSDFRADDGIYRAEVYLDDVEYYSRDGSELLAKSENDLFFMHYFGKYTPPSEYGEVRFMLGNVSIVPDDAEILGDVDIKEVTVWTSEPDKGGNRYTKGDSGHLIGEDGYRYPVERYEPLENISSLKTYRFYKADITVVFEYENGTTTQYIEAGETLGKPDSDTTAKDGYTLVGWKSSLDGETYPDSDIETAPDEDVIYTAVYERNRDIAIIFKGPGVNYQETLYRLDDLISDDEIPDDPEREGWVFTGWESDADGELYGKYTSGKLIQIPRKVEGAVTYTATFAEDNVTVSFKSNNGATIKCDTYPRNTVLPADDIPDKTDADPYMKPGTSFTGIWIDDDGFERSSVWIAEHPITKNTIFTAKGKTNDRADVAFWNPSEDDGYKDLVSDNPKRRSIIKHIPTVIGTTTVAPDGIPELKSYSRKYRFNGWKPTLADTVYADTDYVAEYSGDSGTVGDASEPIYYKVEIYNVPEEIAGPDGKTVREDVKIASPYDRSRDYILFEGVYEEYKSFISSVKYRNYQTDSTKYTFSRYDMNWNDALRQGYDSWYEAGAIADKDHPVRLVFKAKYNSGKVPIRIIFRNWNGDVLSDRTYEYGETITAPATVPTKEADDEYTYVFDKYSPDVETTATKNMTYTARYTKKAITKYKVIFKDWDGQTISERMYKYGDSLIMPAYNPQRQDDDHYSYEFTGWSPEVDTRVKANAVYTAKYTRKRKETEVNPTPSPTPSPTPTKAAEPTKVITPTPTPRITPTPSPTVSPAPRITATPTPIPKPSSSTAVRVTPAPVATKTPTPTPTPTVRPSPTPTPKPTPAKSKITPTPKATRAPTPTPRPTATPTPIPSPTPQPPKEEKGTMEKAGKVTAGVVCGLATVGIAFGTVEYGWWLLLLNLLLIRRRKSFHGILTDESNHFIRIRIPDLNADHPLIHEEIRDSIEAGESVTDLYERLKASGCETLLPYNTKMTITTEDAHGHLCQQRNLPANEKHMYEILANSAGMKPIVNIYNIPAKFDIEIEFDF